jgi:hypothetical protein
MSIDNIPASATTSFANESLSCFDTYFSKIYDSLKELGREQAMVLQFDVAPWRNIEAWLSKHLIPVNTSGAGLGQILNPFSLWNRNHDSEFFNVVKLTANPSLKAGEFWRLAQGQVLPNGSVDSLRSKPPFDVIDASSLLVYPDWRIALARALNLLKPGGWVVFPELNDDIVLLDGRSAEWLRWNDEKNQKMANKWPKIVYQLLRYIELHFNRPWIPELGLSEVAPLSGLLRRLSDEGVTRTSEVRTEAHLEISDVSELLELPCVSAYISEIEMESLRPEAARIFEHLTDERPVQIGCAWNIIRLFESSIKKDTRVSPYRINDVIVQSLGSEDRNLLDSGHHLLPQVTTELYETESAEIERKVLRSLRGFVCRMIHHDRFDPENLHLFVASLWIPRKTDLSKGRFADVTGCVFRRLSDGAEDRFDEALRHITYWAHARVNRMSLQSIPQMLFDTDRPVMKILIGEHWDCQLEGHGQLDLEAESLEYTGSGVRVPSELVITIPNVDPDGSGWRKFREKHVDSLLRYPSSDSNQIRDLRAELLKEIWSTRDGKVYSFPWRAFESDNNDESKRSSRGRVAGLISNLIEKTFGTGRNVLAQCFDVSVPSTFEDLEDPFVNMMRDLLHRLGIPKGSSKWNEIEQKYRQVFYSLIALTLPFPASEPVGKWELLQLPIGAFLYGKQQQFVSAGSCVLIKRKLSADVPRGTEEDLSRRLSNIRSTQLMRRVPNVLLPLSSLSLARMINAEQTEGRIREESARAHELIADLAMTLTHDYVKKAATVNEFLEKSKWKEITPAEAAKDPDYYKQWRAAVSSYLLYNNLNLIYPISRDTKDGGTFLRKHLENSSFGADIRQLIATGIWLAAGDDRDFLLSNYGELKWELLRKPDQGDAWDKVLELFCKPHDLSGVLPILFTVRLRKPAGETALNVSALWEMLFYEIARASFKARVEQGKANDVSTKEGIMSREIRCWLNDGRFTLEFLTWCRPPANSEIREYAKRALGLVVDQNGRVIDAPEANVCLIPGKPTNPDGTGWGRRGNYTLVSRMLGQEYHIYWKTNERADQYALCTRIDLEQSVYYLEEE